MQVALFVAADVLGDAAHTLYHYAAHKVPKLNQYHRVHHEKTQPTARDTFYNHPVDTALATTCRVALPVAAVVAMGADWPVVVVYLFYCAATSMSHHTTHGLAEIVSLGFLPTRAKPGHHLMHHKDPTCKFGENWIWFDYAMGTLVRAAPEPTVPPDQAPEMGPDPGAVERDDEMYNEL